MRDIILAIQFITAVAAIVLWVAIYAYGAIALANQPKRACIEVCK